MTQTSLTVGLGNAFYDFNFGPGMIDPGPMLGEIAADRHTIVVTDFPRGAQPTFKTPCDFASRPKNLIICLPGQARKSRVVLSNYLNIFSRFDRSVFWGIWWGKIWEI
ncbi:MAG: hypothetical protein CM15mP46_6400 [Alphaproteobacteria bacterium]|nr:MAG: hypothetical protein CM15mP46_6400 [Alphaproteobacteria bacterium]